MKHKLFPLKQGGFTTVELLVACVIFPMVAIGVSNAYGAVRKSYTLSRQYNEIYAVLSACPEIDRALEYSSLSNLTNCFPNNTFKTEGGTGFVTTYSPVLQVTDTSSLGTSDPLQTVPDSKVVNITVGFPNSTAPNLELRMLITRNGIGQL